MATSQEFYHIVVICPEREMEPVLFKIKKWFFENRAKYTWHINAKVEKYFNLTSALLAIRNENQQSTILIPIGFHPQEVKKTIDYQQRKNLEIVIRPPRPAIGEELDDFPHSSLLTEDCTVTVQNTLPAIRKSILRKHFRQRIAVRKIQSEDDFQQYFRLRYRVWNEMGYIPAEKRCPKSRYEMDFTDRSALPIGIFNQDNSLIACARLVFPLGRDNYHVPLIKRMIKEADETQLTRNFAYPTGIKHPFDLLECFHGFNAYFANLVRKGIRNAEVSRVIVAPEYQHAGLGEVLVDSLISAAKDERVELLFLACKKEHHRFYQQCGFKPIEGIESEKFADIDQASIAMFNKLS